MLLVIINYPQSLVSLLEE